MRDRTIQRRDNLVGFIHTSLKDTGRPPYDPKDLLKLYVYGYFNRIHSSRKLMTECTRNVELFYLLRKLKPDFRTIADFRKDNAKALKKVFSAFVKLCVKLGLYQKELLAIDGSKFRAVNNKDNTYNAEILEKKLKRIDEHISEYLSQLDTNDATEPETPSSDHIKEALRELTLRKDKYQDYLKELLESGNTQILTTDPEAHRMHTKDGFNCCYNVQTAVDKGSHLIAEYEVTSHNTEPKDIQACIKAGVLPKCYENTVIEVELQGQSVLSCFTLNDDGTVTCPMGNILRKTKKKGSNTIYVSKDACRQCPNRCTDSKKYKTVSFGPGTQYVPVRLYGSIGRKLNPIPADIPINPYNHTLDRRDYTKTKVILRIKKDIHKLKDRMCLSEHPFGTVKWYHGAHYVLCRGKEKVTAELGLSFLAYNMKRAIGLVGTKKLIEAMQM